ncbi:MAG: hypothetical protein K2X11_14130 [Acetobacteraceae bacterium]|nr:hypothetical protein [Acetobacteraceae bacterium]
MRPLAFGAIALAVLAAFLGPALVDPGLFGDDLKTLIAPDTYLTNLRSEARWLVHGWRVTMGALPPWLAFQLCLLAWVGTMAVTADAMLIRQPPAWGLLLTLALAANPGALSLLMWPLSSLPTLLVLLAGAVALRLVPQRPWPIAWTVAGWTALAVFGHQLLALAAVAVSLLIVLGLGAALPPRALMLRLLAVLLAAGVGLALGTLAGFALNAWRFGHFSVVVDPWRFRLLEGVEGPGLAAASAGVRYGLAQLREATWGLFLPLLLGGLALALSLLAPRERRGVVALRLAMAAGILLVAVALPFATGLPLPELRGTMLVWIGLAAVGAFALEGRRVRRAAGALLLAGLVVVGLPRTSDDLVRLSRDEARNRAAMQAILRDVAGRLREPPAKLVLLGAPAPFTGHPGRPGWSWWLHYLMEYEAIAIFGRRLDVEYCPDTCRVHVLPEDRRVAREAWPNPAALQVEGGVAYLRIGG